jgi:hypothetical protein
MSNESEFPSNSDRTIEKQASSPVLQQREDEAGFRLAGSSFKLEVLRSVG